MRSRDSGVEEGQLPHKATFESLEGISPIAYEGRFFMASLKQMIGHERAEELYALKDTLKGERILEDDPMDMNRTRFEKYMAAKAEAIVSDALADGRDSDAAFKSARIYLTMLDSKWRVAAKAHNETILHPKGDIIDMKEAV